MQIHCLDFYDGSGLQGMRHARSVTARCTEDGQDEEDTVALVPYIDLINHNPNSESRIRGAGSLRDEIPGVRRAL